MEIHENAEVVSERKKEASTHDTSFFIIFTFPFLFPLFNETVRATTWLLVRGPLEHLGLGAFLKLKKKH